MFIFGLLLSIIVAGTVFGFDVPLLGSQLFTLPSDMTQGVTVNVSMNAGFQWLFILTLVGVGLCIAVRIYHKKFVQSSSLSVVFKSPTIISSSISGKGFEEF
ncbi:MAG: hypothetical protein P8X91_01360 [Candidatus Bathyarchaeota archaeon]